MPLLDSKIQEFLDSIQESFSKNELKRHIYASFGESTEENRIENFVEAIYSRSNSLFGEFWPDFLLLMTIFTIQKMDSYYPKFGELLSNPGIVTIQKGHTVNKEINKTKNEPAPLSQNEDEEPLKKGEEGFNLKQVEILSLGQEQAEQLPAVSSKKLSGYSYPIIPEQEVDRIVSDIQYAVSDSLKLFINTVWFMLEEYLQDNPSEQDEEETSVITDISGYTFPVEDFQSEILNVAYEEVEGYVEKGCIELDNGETLSLQFKEMFPANLISKVFKWERTELSQGEAVYKISQKGIYDVLAEKVQRANQPETREERRKATYDGFEYMTKLYCLSMDSNKGSQFTPIEKIISQFISDYMEPDESNPDLLEPDVKWYRFHVRQGADGISDEGALTKLHWKLFKKQVSDAGYTEQELLSCLLNNKGPTQYEQLIIQPCMFFAEGIRTLNKIHGHKSIIDEAEVDIHETLR